MARTLLVIVLAVALLGGIWMLDQYVGCNGRGWEMMYRQGVSWWHHMAVNVPHNSHSFHLSGPGIQPRHVDLLG